MGRRATAWFRADRDAWYVKLDGRQIRLAVGKGGEADAKKELRRLLAERDKLGSLKTGNLSVAAVCALYDAHAQKNLAPVTASRYREFLERFAGHSGALAASEARPKHVADWLDTKPTWGVTTRHNAITAVKRAFAWAAKAGHIADDPLAKMERPRPRRREDVADAGKATAMIASAVSPEFRDLLTVLRETGCRPGEAVRIEARHIDWERRIAVLAGKTTARTGRARVIHLTEAAMVVLAGCAERHGEGGPLLRNTKGQPWTRTALNTQMRRLRDRAGLTGDKGAVLYAFRHLWVTDALEAGEPIATVAELAGHRGTAMIERHYSHLSERHAHLQASLSRIRPGGRTALPPPAAPPLPGGDGAGEPESPTRPPPQPPPGRTARKPRNRPAS